MSGFTKLEEAALHAIFAETPGFAPILEQQFGKATVTKRNQAAPTQSDKVERLMASPCRSKIWLCRYKGRWSA